jgi:Sec-independent protein secretion pathway component TatC
LEIRKDKLYKYGCQLQPVAAIVGPTFKDVKQSFAIVGPRLYEVETPLKAVDITFKAFHALNVEYPAEACQIWQFLQRGIYKIPRDPQCDPYITFVETLLGDLSLSLV